MKILIEGAISKLYGIEEQDADLPAGEVVIGRNGAFKVGSSEIFNIVKPAPIVWNAFKSISTVAEMKKKIPWEVFWTGPSWLKKQWGKKKNTEYVLMLMYNQELGEFQWACPTQSGKAASVDFKVSEDPDIRKMIEDGWDIAGSIHNHFGPKGSAFQSGTDSHDEQKLGAAGIHFTMGYMDASSLYDSEFHIRIVDGDFSKEIKLEDCIDGIPSYTHPAEWDEKVNKIVSTVTTTTSSPETLSNIQAGKWIGPESHKHNNVYTGGQGRWYGPGGTVYTGEEKKPTGGWTAGKNANEKSGENKPAGFSGWKTSGVSKPFSGKTSVAKKSGEFDILSDIPVIFDSPDDNHEYVTVSEKYPNVSSLHSGSHLMQAITMLKVIADCSTLALVDAKTDDDEEVYVKTLEEISEAALLAVKEMKIFFDDQESRIASDDSEDSSNDKVKESGIITEDDVKRAFNIKENRVGFPD